MQINNLNELSGKIHNVVTQSQAMFQPSAFEGINYFQSILMLFKQYEYLKSKISSKPEYLSDFVKNYQNILGVLNQSMGFNPKQVQNELQNETNKRIQQEFNKLEELRRALTLGFEKQILIFMDDNNQNTAAKINADTIIQSMQNPSNKNLEQEQQEKYSIPTHLFNAEFQFREHIANKTKSQPIIIITTRSVLLNNSIIEYINDRNLSNFFRLEGLICLCQPNKVESTRRSFEECTLPIQFVNSQKGINESLYEIINKNKFLRIIEMKDFLFYMNSFSVNKFQEKVVSLYKKNTQLSQYSPQQQNYNEMLVKISNQIKNYNISIYPECYDNNAISDICNELSSEVFNTNDDNRIAENFVRLYTQESPFYKLLNSCLNVLNQELINLVEPLITPLYLSLLNVNKQEQSIFATSNQSEVFLYRGTTIPAKSKNLILKNNSLVFPAFSSFSSDKGVALNFITLQKSDQDYLKVLFVVKCQRNVKDPHINPKYLKYLSANGSEEEYLFPPFCLFNVTDSVEENGIFKVFLKF